MSARTHRQTWGTVDVRADDVNLHDVVEYAGHVWDVLEGDRYSEDGMPLSGDPDTDLPPVLIELNLTRVKLTGHPSPNAGTPVHVGRESKRLLLAPEDRVTVQTAVGHVDVDAGLGKRRTQGIG